MECRIDSFLVLDKHVKKKRELLPACVLGVFLEDVSKLTQIIMCTTRANLPEFLPLIQALTVQLEPRLWPADEKQWILFVHQVRDS